MLIHASLLPDSQKQIFYWCPTCRASGSVLTFSLKRFSARCQTGWEARFLISSIDGRRSVENALEDSAGRRLGRWSIAMDRWLVPMVQCGLYYKLMEIRGKRTDDAERRVGKLEGNSRAVECLQMMRVSRFPKWNESIDSVHIQYWHRRSAKSMC